MKDSLLSRNNLLLFLFMACYSSYAQIDSNVYYSEQEKDGNLIQHELKIDGDDPHLISKKAS